MFQKSRVFMFKYDFILQNFILFFSYSFPPGKERARQLNQNAEINPNLKIETCSDPSPANKFNP